MTTPDDRTDPTGPSGHTEEIEERDPSDAQGDAGDQAQDLRTRLEQEAIEAALEGHPRGSDRPDGG